MSKTLDNILKKYPDKIDSYYKDSDGYWIKLKQGYILNIDGTHWIHEDKIIQCLQKIKDIVKE